MGAFGLECDDIKAWQTPDTRSKPDIAVCTWQATLLQATLLQGGGGRDGASLRRRPSKNIGGGITDKGERPDGVQVSSKNGAAFVA